MAQNWDEHSEVHPLRTVSHHDHDRDHGQHPSPSSTQQPIPSTPLSKDKKNTASASPSSSTWAAMDPGPSTPSKRPPQPRRLQSSPQTENWDDDFQDADSPGPSSPRRHLHPLTREESSSTTDSPMVENWDDDFEDAAPRSGAAASSPRRRTPRKRSSWPSSDDDDDDDAEYGFADGDREEDRTVTSRSRGMHLPFHLPADSPPPPVPPLPSPFPRSPTASVFSVPVSSTTGRDSVTGYSYSSTAHLALRPTLSGSGGGSSAARLALLPPSPPIHRERRRLRKKSRPPPNFEDGIFELDDRAETVDLPARPVTPDQQAKKATAADDGGVAAPDVANTSTAHSSGKTPLLSRIGSVGKKWGTAARKKRASTGPSEVMLREAPPGAESSEDNAGNLSGSRPTSFVASTSPAGGSRGWFFRGGGGGHGPPGSPPTRDGAPLKSEKSVERLLHLMRAERNEREAADEPEPSSPTRERRRRSHAREAGLPRDLEQALDGSSVPASTLLFGGGTPRRPTSMQISQSSSGGSSWSTRPPVPRHASHGDGRHRRPVTPSSSSRASSKQRSASASVEDVHQGRKGSTSALEVADDRSSDAHSYQHRPPLPPASATESSATEKEKGSRRFMGGMRRISLVSSGKHKRNKSTAPEPPPPPLQRPPSPAPEPPSDMQDQSTPRPPSRVVRSSQDMLLPPIELQPPSPPRPRGGRKTPPSVPGTTPTRRSLNGSRPSLEPSRSHPTLSPRPSPSQGGSQGPPLPTIPSPLPSPTRPKPSTSPVQTASLGRTAQPPKERDAQGPSGLRRNSLGDLKIPARISQAQVSLRRDLSMVRDFASSVEQLKQLQSTYTALVIRVRELLCDPQESQSRPVSPSFIHLPKPVLRSRSNTNPAANASVHRNRFNTAFLNIEAKYRLSWECAELLIDLAGGGTTNAATPTSAPPSSSQSAPAIPTAGVDGRKSRERAITLAGDEQKPVIAAAPTHGASSPPLASPPSSQWRASTGRHDLSQRQLLLLREMLNNPDPNATLSFEPKIAEEEIDRRWRWGDAMNSTVTLPSEEESGGRAPSPTKKRRTSRLGMRGLRDMLKSLKKTYSEQGQGAAVLPRVPASTSSISASTDSSLNLAGDSRPPSVARRRRAKTSTGPESVASRREGHPNSPYGTTQSVPHKSSPRRPSLASIFRLGQKTKTAHGGAGQSADDLRARAPGGQSDDFDEDWDRIESVSDLDHATRMRDGTATVRGKKGQSPYLFQREAGPATPRRPDASASSIWGAAGESPQKPSAIPPSTLQSYQRSIKLSDVREAGEGDASGGGGGGGGKGDDRRMRPRSSPRRPVSRPRTHATGSVRSAPSLEGSPGPLPDAQLAMSPENIKPLLENAREVHARCADCIAELEALLSAVGAAAAPPPSTAHT